MEPEYHAIVYAATEIIWLRSLFFELGSPHLAPTILWCDNIGSTYLAVNPVFHSHMKHMEISFYFVQEMVQQGHLQVRYISIKD